MKNRKYFYCTLLATLLFIVVLWIIAFNLPPKKDSYNRAYEDKLELLKEETMDNRLILVGGSNVAFGMDSKTLEDKLQSNYEVINMGLHAGIGLIDILEDQKKYAKKGDIIVVIPEYIHFAGGFGDEAFWDIASIRGVKPSDFKYLDHRFLTGCKYSLMKLNGAIGDAVDKIRGKEKLKHDFEYNREGFNEKGDFVGHWKIDLGPIEFKPKAMNEKVNNTMFRYLEKFNNEMQAKSIKVLYVPPVYNKDAATLDMDFIDETVTKLHHIGIDFIAPPKDYFYNKELFFDTIYHLNKSGIDKRMIQLSNDINRVIK